jgi:hypothetical protein
LIRRYEGMYRIPLIYFAIVVLAASMASAATQQQEIAPEVKIIRAEFGLFNPPESGKPAFIPTLTVPFKIDQGYGWVIEVSTTKHKVKWREELTLPEAPATWDEGKRPESQAISADGKTSILEGEMDADNGILHNVWAVVEGDPKGKYVIRVTIEGSQERVFEFEVK